MVNPTNQERKDHWLCGGANGANGANPKRRRLQIPEGSDPCVLRHRVLSLDSAFIRTQSRLACAQSIYIVLFLGYSPRIWCASRASPSAIIHRFFTRVEYTEVLAQPDVN